MPPPRPSRPRPPGRAAPRRASGRWVPAAELGIGALGQPALDVLKDFLVVDLVEDLVVHAGIEAEGSLGCRGAGKKTLAAGWIDDLVVAALHQKKGNADLAGSRDELLAAPDGVPIEAAGNAVVDQRIRRIAAGDLGIMA